MATELIYKTFVQQGDTQFFRVPDQDAFYVLRETWQDSGLLLDTHIVSKHEVKSRANEAAKEHRKWLKDHGWV